MLINNVHCDECGHSFDATLSRCPRCHKNNEQRATLNFKNKVAFIPLVHQFLCLIIGLAGLYLFELIFQICFYNFVNPSDQSSNLKLHALTVYPSYVCLFIVLIVIIFGYIQELTPYFKKALPYLTGILFGIGLIVFSIVYTTIINQFAPNIGLNDNEDIARQLTTYYPFISIIVLGFIGPICEEITYRLGLFSICSRFNRWFAYILTVIVFALIHFDFTSKNLTVEAIYLPVYIFSGLLLCIAYEQEGPAASITAHIVNNLYSVIGVLIASGINR